MQRTLFKITEEYRACDYTNRTNKQDQPQSFNHAWSNLSKMPKYQCNDQHSRCAERNTLDFNSAK